MALIKNPLSGGGGGASLDILNGIIKQYKASHGVIDANTFVEFVNSGPASSGTDTQLSSSSRSYMNSAVLLPNGDVFVAHSGDGTQYQLYGVIVSLAGGQITVGTATQLSNESYSGYTISCVLLDNGDVFIAHSYTNSFYLYGIIVSISGTTITAGSDTRLISDSSNGLRISAVLLDNGDVFIAHSKNSSASYLAGIVVSISGTTITAGTDSQYGTINYTGYSFSTVLLPSGNVFIAHGSNDRYLHGVVAIVSGTTVSWGTGVTLDPVSLNSSDPDISAVLLTSGDVFVAYDGSYPSQNKLFGVVVEVSGSTVKPAIATQLSDVANSGNNATAVLLNSGDVFVTHKGPYEDTSVLYGMVVTVKGTSPIPGSDNMLSDAYFSDNYCSLTRLDNEKVFISHGGGASPYYLFGMIVDLSDVHRLISATDAQGIGGLTAGSMTDSIAGDVWVLDTSES